MWYEHDKIYWLLIRKNAQTNVHAHTMFVFMMFIFKSSHTDNGRRGLNLAFFASFKASTRRWSRRISIWHRAPEIGTHSAWMASAIQLTVLWLQYTQSDISNQCWTSLYVYTLQIKDFLHANTTTYRSVPALWRIWITDVLLHTLTNSQLQKWAIIIHCSLQNRSFLLSHTVFLLVESSWQFHPKMMVAGKKQIS